MANDGQAEEGSVSGGGRHPAAGGGCPTALPASDADGIVYHSLDLFSKFGSSFMVFTRSIDADHIGIFPDHSRKMKITFSLIACHIHKSTQTLCHTVDSII